MGSRGVDARKLMEGLGRIESIQTTTESPDVCANEREVN